MIRRDQPEVLDIEEQAFGEQAWTEEDFVKVLRQRNCIAMVAEHRELVVGYFVYELHPNRLRLLNFAVHPHYRRCRVGEQMLRKLIGKLSPQKRKRMTMAVRETNLNAQLFFRTMGFRAIRVLRDFYDGDPSEDAYLMQYRHVPGSEPTAQ